MGRQKIIWLSSCWGKRPPLPTMAFYLYSSLQLSSSCHCSGVHHGDTSPICSLGISGCYQPFMFTALTAHVEFQCPWSLWPPCPCTLLLLIHPTNLKIMHPFKEDHWDFCTPLNLSKAVGSQQSYDRLISYGQCYSTGHLPCWSWYQTGPGLLLEACILSYICLRKWTLVLMSSKSSHPIISRFFQGGVGIKC